MFRYRLTLEPDDNGTVLVTSPDFPVVTYGNDEAEALRNAVDATEGILQSMMDAREDIPIARDTKSGHHVNLPLQTNLKLALYVALRAQNMTRADLQRRLRWQRESVDRLFKLSHNSKVEQLDEAFQALGREVDIATRELELAVLA